MTPQLSVVIDDAKSIAALARRPNNERAIYEATLTLADKLRGTVPANAEVLSKLGEWRDPQAANMDISAWRNQCATRGDMAGQLVADGLTAVVGYFALVAPRSLIPTDAQMATIGNASSPQMAVQILATFMFKFEDDKQKNRETYEHRRWIASAILPVLRQVFGSVVSNWGGLGGMTNPFTNSQRFDAQDAAVQQRVNTGASHFNRG